ncbi:MAG: acyltransferase [Candidatus Magasanikbacteria bacterium]|nr:acyltransferase [Candidatus Magasanikbacteria bacterium]
MRLAPYTLREKIIVKISQHIMPTLTLFLWSHRLNTLVWRLLGANVGRKSTIRLGTIINAPFAIKIGNGSHIHGNFLSRGGVTIGNRVYICNATISTQAQDLRSPQFEPIFQPVVFEDHAWVSLNSTVLQGVTVKEGGIVAAGAVVTNDVAPWTVVGGVPAKPIGERARLIRN